MFLKGDRVVITNDVVNDSFMRHMPDVKSFSGLTATVISSSDYNDKFFQEDELAIRIDPDERYRYGTCLLIHSTSVVHYRENAMLKPVDDDSLNTLFS